MAENKSFFQVMMTPKEAAEAVIALGQLNPFLATVFWDMLAADYAWNSNHEDLHTALKQIQQESKNKKKVLSHSDQNDPRSAENIITAYHFLHEKNPVAGMVFLQQMIIALDSALLHEHIAAIKDFFESEVVARNRKRKA